MQKLQSKNCCTFILTLKLLVFNTILNNFLIVSAEGNSIDSKCIAILSNGGQKMNNYHGIGISENNVSAFVSESFIEYFSDHM